MENFSPVCRGEHSPVLHVSLQPGMNFGVFVIFSGGKLQTANKDNIHDGVR